MRARLSAKAESEWGEGSGLFGLEGQCKYEWQLAIGDVTRGWGKLCRVPAANYLDSYSL
jgi:hypothetical protein